MKTVVVCIAASLAVMLAGCRSSHDTIGDAPRKETTSSVAGWKEISTSGIALQLPSDWKTMDLSRESFEQGADKVFGNDPKYAALRSQASAMAKQGVVKLIAFETTTIGSGFATNCNVVIQNTPGQVTLDQVADATVQQLSGVVASGTQPKLEYVSLPSGRTAVIRSQINPPNPSVPALASIAYLSQKGSTMAVVTFTAPVTEEVHIRAIADQAMSKFRFTD